MKPFRFVCALILLSFATSIVTAYDASPLQDFCVAIDDPKEAVIVNGKFCKNPKEATANDFSFSGLNIPGNTENQDGSNVTLLNVDLIPGLNTLGTSIARIDYAPNGGLTPLHTHPRGTEVILVLEGTLYSAFVTSNPNHTLFTKVLNPGDVFVIPIGLIHFQFNLAKTNAVAVAAFNSQNPGLIPIASSVFGAHPLINPQVLIKAFQLNKDEVIQLQKKFGGT